MKQNKNIFVLILIFILCTATLAVGAIFADDLSNPYTEIAFNLENVTAGTKVFKFDNTAGNYYKAVSFSGLSHAVTIQKTLPSGTYYTDANNEFVNYFRYNNVTSFDLLIFTNAANKDANFTLNGYSSAKYEISTGACTIISNVTYTGGDGINPHVINLESSVVDVNANIVVLTYTSVNSYVKNIFDLKMTNNEKKHNFYYDPEGPMTTQTYFKFVYFIDSLVLMENLTLNYPSYVNLLYSNITLNEDIVLEIKHHERGVFAIENLSGKINNSATNSVFSINCPNAYYRSITEQSAWWAGIVNDVSTSKFKQICDVTIAENATVRGYILEDSLNFVKSTLSFKENVSDTKTIYNILQDFILPTNYHKYDVAYSYEILTSQSVLALKDDYTVMLNRAATNTAVEIKVTATLSYQALGSTQEQTQTTTIDLNVVGTDRTPFLDTLAVMFELYRIQVGLYDMQDNEYKLANSLDIARIILDYTTIFFKPNTPAINKYDFIVEIAPTRINLDFEYLTERYRKLNFSYDNANNCYAVTFNEDSLSTVPLRKYTGVSGEWSYEYVEIYINPQNLLLENADEMLTISIELEDTTTYSKDITFKIDGITFEEQMNYLERYIETLFFSSSTDILKILRIDTLNNGIYKGPVDDDNEVIPYTFGFEDVIYTVYKVNKTALKDYFTEDSLDANEKLETLLDHAVKYASDVFDIENGTLKAGSGIVLRVEDLYSLFVKMEFKYPAGSAISSYNTIRELILPTSGFGEEELYEYMKGNTFGPYFSGAEPSTDNTGVTRVVDGKLINSTADVWQSGSYLGLTSPYSYTELLKKLGLPEDLETDLPSSLLHVDAGTGYRFKPKIDRVRLKMDIYVAGQDDSDDTVKAAALAQKTAIKQYCNIVETQFTSKSKNYWQINIDVDKVPSTNSYIQVKVEFYEIVKNGDIETENIISEQYYSFTIPGIYRLGEVGSQAEFHDSNLYKYLIESKIYDSFKGYIIADSCKSEAVDLDCSYDAIYNTLYPLGLFTTSSTLNVRGVDLLESAFGMTFDNWEIESLQPFTKFTTYELKKLSLVNCKITNTDIKTYSLYSLNNLTELYLDYNELSILLDDSGKALFYRTIKILSLTNNEYFELRGLGTLSQLRELYIQNNKIRSFSSILDVKTLTKLCIGENIADEFAHTENADDENIYYGTKGKINIPLYVMFIERGMKVYANERDFNPMSASPDTLHPITIEGIYEINGITPYISNDEYFAALIVNSMFVFETQYKFAWFYDTIAEFTNTNIATTHYEISYIYMVQTNISLGAITSSAVTAGTPTNGPYENINVLQTESALLNGEFKLIISIDYIVVGNTVTMYREFDLIFKP